MGSRSNICFPLDVPISPLRLASDYRDYWGDYHARLVELIDPILDAGCYQPRIYHAPAQDLEVAGVSGLGFLDYDLAITAGSWILGFMHSYTSAPSANSTDAPVTSSFRFQFTEIRTDRKPYRFFAKSVPEAWLLNDQPTSNPQSPIAGGPGGGLYLTNPSPRLLTAPYPVTPGATYRVEFWNLLATVNKDIRLSVVVAEPIDATAGDPSGGVR